MSQYKQIYQKLLQIYNKHRAENKENCDSKQMCLMWPISDPPDFVEDTEPIEDIEQAFNIKVDEDQAIELFDMDLKEAAKRIMEWQKEE